MPGPVWQELDRWRTVQKRQRLTAGATWQALGFVFTTSLGTPLHGARRSFERVCAAAELGTWGPAPEREHPTGPLPKRSFTPAFGIYDLRHTFVSLQLMHGVPVNVVADLAGHETGAFTIARYGHALPTQVAQATETLTRVLFRTA
jgi:integrase